MRILHYFPGFSRAGGLNRYAADLARAQAAAGHQVTVLYPVSTLTGGAPEIVKSGSCGNISCYALRDRAPIPLLEGIRDPEKIIHAPALTREKMEKFIAAVKPEIFHIHTWMGIAPELTDLLKKSQTRVIFTAHDYFGLCPRVNFIDAQGGSCAGGSDQRCSECNSVAPGSTFLTLRNLPLVLKLKPVLKPLAAALRRGRKKETCKADGKTGPVVTKNFRSLAGYYEKMLSGCDAVHFNSRVTESVYRQHLPELKVPSAVIPITHGGISDRRELRRIDPTAVRLGFFGPGTPYKGLPQLLDVLKELESSGIRNWRLSVYGDAVRENFADIPEQVGFCGAFAPSEEYGILQCTDLLIVPSIWFETFGFVVCEALSAGVPVLVSDRVGAQILVDESMVFHGREGLSAALRGFLTAPEKLEKMNRQICDGAAPAAMPEHAAAMEGFYQRVRRGDL